MKVTTGALASALLMTLTVSCFDNAAPSADEFSGPAETPQNAPEGNPDRNNEQLKSSQDNSMVPSNADAAFAEARRRMVDEQLASRDIVNPRVLAAMAKVPRHLFVPNNLQSQAYADFPLPIGHGQTISQPYIVALMTQLVDPQPHMKALDIGTGSGYQAAILAEIVESVHSIEIVEALADESRIRLQTLGYKNIEVRQGDGYQGWESEAPFDLITVAAAPDHVPQPLIDQLAAGGKLVIPVGEWHQALMLLVKNEDGTVDRRNVAPVTFVPMTGEAQE